MATGRGTFKQLKDSGLQHEDGQPGAMRLEEEHRARTLGGRDTNEKPAGASQEQSR